MLERDFQTKFGHWLKANKRPTAAYELKVARTGVLPFASVPQHQRDGLWHAKHGYLYMKLPDVGYQMPFDCFALNSVEAYVVVYYPDSRMWYAIDIDDFIAEVDTSARKSLVEDRAKALCKFSS